MSTEKPKCHDKIKALTHRLLVSEDLPVSEEFLDDGSALFIFSDGEEIFFDPEEWEQGAIILRNVVILFTVVDNS